MALIQYTDPRLADGLLSGEGVIAISHGPSGLNSPVFQEILVTKKISKSISCFRFPKMFGGARNLERLICRNRAMCVLPLNKNPVYRIYPAQV